MMSGTMTRLMYKNANPYSPIESEVLAVLPETASVKTIQLRPKETVRFETGQFIELTIPGVGEAPFTPSSNPRASNHLEITVMKVGKVTDKIHQLKPGDRVGVRGPFGTSYPLKRFMGREILVVGGGCGFAPLRSLIYEFFNRTGEFKKILFRGGCRTPAEFLYRNQVEEWRKRDDIEVELTVDELEGADNWTGKIGLVTALLDDLDMEIKEGIAVVCGPPIMMKFSTKKLTEIGFRDENIYLSMEKNMSCGLGLCGHCRIGLYYSCKDGPVFSYDMIKDFHEIWE